MAHDTTLADLYSPDFELELDVLDNHCNLLEKIWIEGMTLLREKKETSMTATSICSGVCEKGFKWVTPRDSSSR